MQTKLKGKIFLKKKCTRKKGILTIVQKGKLMVWKTYQALGGLTFVDFCKKYFR